MLFGEEVKKLTSLSSISNLIIVASLKRLAVRVPKSPA